MHECIYRVEKSDGAFTLHVASASSPAPVVHNLDLDGEPLSITVKFGDHSTSLEQVNSALAEVSF